ncbi:MAG: alpha-amylase family glycosyl hydrolase [Puniceicoccaceae bacterium]
MNSSQQLPRLLLCLIATGCLYLPSMGERSFADEVIYFVMTDRFENGDASNDTGNFNPGTVRGVHGFDPTDTEYYHGGDFAGLRQRLDYIQGLGASAIWVTPVMGNKPVQHGTAAYHGYWITDFLNVDAHLGTNAEFKAFVEDAHARGIRVILDIVANHTADVIYFAEGQYDYRNKGTWPYLDANGFAFDDAGFAASGITDPVFPELSANSFPYTPQVPLSELTIKNPSWLNDPTFYHNRGNSNFSGESSLYGDFYGLDDLFTEQGAVLDGMLDIFSHWIREYRLDGFRVDTVKHVNLSFWKRFGERLREVAREEGIEHFFLFGEVYDGDVPFVSAFSTTGSLDANLDFGLAFALREFISQGGSASSVKSYLNLDDLHTDADSTALAQPTFLGNHDMGRWAGFLRQDNPTTAESTLISLWKTGYALLFFLRGQPVIYYGDEQGFVGAGGYSAAREDMLPSQAAVYMASNLMGTFRTPTSANFYTDHPMYVALSEMAAFYHAEPVLRHGAFKVLDVADNRTLAFTRYDPHTGEEFLIAANANRSQPVTLSLPVLPGNETSTYTTVYDSEEPATGSFNATQGAINLTVGPHRVVVLKADNPVSAGNTAIESVTFYRLESGDLMEGGNRSRDGQVFPLRPRIEIRITADRDPFVSLDLILSDGSRLPLGTDPAPPYRFYPDLSELPDGSQFTLEATATVGTSSLKASVEALEWNGAPLGDDVVVHFNPGATDGSEWRLVAEGPGLNGGSVTEVPFCLTTDFGWAAIISPQDKSEPLQIQIIRGSGTTLGVDRQFYGGHTIIPSRTPQVFSLFGYPRLYFREAEATGKFTIIVPDIEGTSAEVRLRFGDGTQSPWLSAVAQSGNTRTFIWEASLEGDDAYWNTACSLEVKVDGNLLPANLSFLPAAGSTWRANLETGSLHRPGTSTPGSARLHYHRPGGDYGDSSSSDYNDYWGLHVWNGSAVGTTWTQPLKPAGSDAFGIYFDIPLQPGATQVNYILHRGNIKDPGPDQQLDIDASGPEVWQQTGADSSSPYILDTSPVRPSGYPASLSEARARAFSLQPSGSTWTLSVETVPGRLYTLEASKGLNLWSTMNEPFEGDGASWDIPIGDPEGLNWLRMKIE